MRRLRQDATPTDQTQGPFLLMLFISWGVSAPGREGKPGSVLSKVNFLAVHTV